MKAIYLKDNNNNKVVTVPYYRVGDLFLTTIATNPSEYLGGKWELFGPGRCLVCVNSSDSDFNTVKKTGGSKYLQSHYHSIDLYTTSDGDHEHSIRYGGSSGSGVTISHSGSGYRVLNLTAWEWTECSVLSNVYSSYTGNHQHKVSGITGSDGAGNSGNLQPYITCYIWIRTA